ncbi:MAG: hypothetical protein RE472_00595 [Thermoplasmatales archaeon]|jgi:hypothetical protein|nr:MAG: hypothetical protein RE472_00595 [Thermoplasmatales archaeon]
MTIVPLIPIIPERPHPGLPWEIDPETDIPLIPNDPGDEPIDPDDEPDEERMGGAS